MKERLIAFTRDEKNLIWMIIFYMILGIILCFGLDSIGVSSMGLISLVLFIGVLTAIDIVVLLGFAIFLLFFEEDVEKIRNNNFFILLLSMDNYIWFPIFAVVDLIYKVIIAVLGISLGILGSIIAFICPLLFSFLLGNIVAKHFSKKIK